MGGEELFDFDDSIVVGKIAALVSCVYERAGPWYEIYQRKRTRQHTLSTGSGTASGSDSDSDDSDIELDEDDENFLRSLDPKEWKHQDHYKVLGLTKLRYKATNAHVRVAYKKKVLLHHPDKRKAAGKAVKDDDDYYTNITKAYEILSNPITKRAFDSVDPEINDAIPGNNVAADKFYSTFTAAFERNARWATLKRGERIPKFGDENSTRDQVDNFYRFWYDLKSWRDFSYLDEEDKEQGTDRWERRQIELENRKARKERSKEESKRIRQLVDNAYGSDPRIAKFKQDEKDKKAAQKQAKRDAAKARAEEEARVRREAEEAERKKKEEEEALAKAKAEANKREKEATEKAIEDLREGIWNKAKEHNYFVTDASKMVSVLGDLEKLIASLDLLRLQNLHEKMTESKEAAKNAVNLEMDAMKGRLESERKQQVADKALRAQTTSHERAKAGAKWEAAEIQLLVKAVNLFPAGTKNRWEVVGSFLTQHLPTSQRSAKEVLAQTKLLQKDGSTQKKQVNEAAFKKTMDVTATKTGAAPSSQSMDDPSKRYMSPGEAIVVDTGANTLPWTVEEQKLLEQALRTYPSGTAERWDKIAGCLPTRSKKDCMLRFKELAELVKSKKAAEQAAAKKK